MGKSRRIGWEEEGEEEERDHQQMMEKKVQKWTKMLANEDKIEHALRRLEHVQISLQLLSSTGVGKAVNALRKNALWGERASGLVARWKEAAREETARMAEEEEKKEEVTDSEEDGEEGGTEEEEEEQQEMEEVVLKHPALVIRIKNGSIKASKSESSSGYSSPASLPPQYGRSAGRKRPANSDDKSEDEEGPMDAFSAQLAAADQTSKIANRKKKAQKGISAESIQNSLMESLNSTETFVTAVPKPQCQHSEPNNMFGFKAPKEMKRVYAGKRKAVAPGTVHQVPRLFDICIRLLIANIDSIEETGSIPYDVLKPVLEKASAEQLARLEKKNPYLRADTDGIWKSHCKQKFGKELAKWKEELRDEYGDEEAEEEEDEAEIRDGMSWRKRYKKFALEREQRLKRLSTQIKSHINDVAQPQRQAMETAPIAPRHVRKRQIQNRIHVPACQVPSAVDLTRARRQIFENGNDADLRSMPLAIRSGGGSGAPSNKPNGSFGTNKSTSWGSSSAKQKPQRGPLMLKTLRMLKNQRR